LSVDDISQIVWRVVVLGVLFGVAVCSNWLHGALTAEQIVTI
jgi:hypothetical protein